MAFYTLLLKINLHGDLLQHQRQSGNKSRDANGQQQTAHLDQQLSRSNGIVVTAFGKPPGSSSCLPAKGRPFPVDHGSIYTITSFEPLKKRHK